MNGISLRVFRKKAASEPTQHTQETGREAEIFEEPSNLNQENNDERTEKEKETEQEHDEMM